MKKVVVPSIIAKSQKELDERIKKVNSKIYQLDIMDGKFVKNKSLMFPLILPRGKKYEAHLMVKNPKSWILKNWGKVDTIIFHAESLKKARDAYDLIDYVKDKNRKVGIAINPKTNVNKILQFINSINLILVMTVNPGRYGSKFLPKTLKKIKELRKLKPRLNIEVDGGIGDKTINLALKSGANSFVVGSYLQKNENPKKAIKVLRDIIK